MKQQEFMYASANMKAGATTQDDIGNTVVSLQSDISVSHNYKKKDQMLITFSKDSVSFIIPSKSELEKIYSINLMNPNATPEIRKYCEEKLSRK